MMWGRGLQMNWHEMLNPAPLSVCLLGQLLLVTLDRDVSLISDNMERKEFRHFRHPESLLTSMVQVANEGWSAFNTANENNNQIRLLTLQVPQHVKKSFKLIIGGSDEEIEELVPDILRNVTRIVETCTEKAEEMERLFTKVMEVLGELQEACVLAKDEYERKFTQKKPNEEMKIFFKAGLKALQDVKSQWGTLFRFFQTLTNLIKYHMVENVKNFVQCAERGKEFRLEFSFSEMLRDVIFTHASEANKIAFMVNNLSAMYVEVSEKHIMDQVASLCQLLALDPETEKHLIVKKKLDLKRQAQDATSSIADIVRQRQKEFDTKIQKMIKTIETEMRAVLPPAKPGTREVEAEMKRAIEDAQ